MPVSVTVSGRYFKITRFVRSTQALVKMRGGKIKAKGRLFAVQSIELGESATREVPAAGRDVVLHAFVYDGPIAPPKSPEADGESRAHARRRQGAPPDGKGEPTRRTRAQAEDLRRRRRIHAPLLAIQLPGFRERAVDRRDHGARTTPTPGVPSGAVHGRSRSGGAAAAGSQLRSRRLRRKDPFVQQIKDPRSRATAWWHGRRR